MDGLLRCSRYAFGPNRLHYCGPDNNREVFSYITEGEADEGLKETLTQFETMYPYLRHIATANKIKEPLDERVVEAYWIGNKLLENVSKKDFYNYLVDDFRLKEKLDTKSFNLVSDKIGEGALPHHSFHVLDVWRRTGKQEREHTVQNMSDCLVRVGKVVSVSGPFLEILTEPLVYENGKLLLGTPIQQKMLRELESDYDIEQLKPGDLVSIHWNVISEKLTKEQAKNLIKYTKWHIKLANETL